MTDDARKVSAVTRLPLEMVSRSRRSIREAIAFDALRIRGPFDRGRHCAPGKSRTKREPEHCTQEHFDAETEFRA